jgi:predicted metal-dependent peptidase
MAKKNVKAIYDTCGMLVKQAEAQAAEGKDVDQSILNALTEAFNQILEFEKIYLIQCQDRFYGSILMDLDFGIDFTQRGPVDLKIDRSPFMLGVNPLFCSKYKFPEFTGLIVNEIVKMVWLHPASFANLNHEKDNKKHELLEKASSAASTSVVKRDIRLVPDSDYGSSSNGCRLPDGSYTPTALNAELGVKSTENMPLEYYYNILNKFKKPTPPGGDGGMPIPGLGDGKGVATENNNKGEQCHNWEGADSEEVKEQITSIVSNAYNSLNERARGMIPSSVLSQIKALLEPPEINWKQVLRKMVGSVPVPYRKTRTRLNRRQPYRADLCGKLPKRTVNVVCCFDTSGSMSDSDLKYCMNEVFNIIKSYEGYKVTIIECDAEIQRVYQVRNMNEVETKMRGRGGTSFLPVIQYINGEKPYDNPTKYPLAGKFKDALMVYFTDGFGDYEIPKPKTYRNLWVVLHDVKNLSLKEPYGDVKSLSMDDDYKKMKNGH